jgi:hypothetical protein
MAVRAAPIMSSIEPNIHHDLYSTGSPELLPDVVREMFRAFEQQMMDAEVENACGTGYGDVSPRRGEPFRSAGDAGARPS